jgi:hypothetical protein
MPDDARAPRAGDGLTRFVPRGSLAYDRLLAPPAEGEPFLLDDAYRLAHLPLVNAQHPDVVASIPGKDYRNGVHGRVLSLVLPIPDSALADSAGFQALEGDLRSASFAGKIAWDVADRRRGRLHATLCGSLGAGRATRASRRFLRSARSACGWKGCSPAT